MNTPVILFIIGQTIAIVGIIFTAYIKIITRQKELEIRVNHIENQDTTILNKLDSIQIESTKKLDELKQQIQDIKINMAKLPCDEHSLQRIIENLKK